jgi:hypothetical protein
MSDEYRLVLRWALLVVMLYVSLLLFDTELRFFYQGF